MTIEQLIAQYGTLIGLVLYLVFITYQSMMADQRARRSAQAVITKERAIINDMLVQRDKDYRAMVDKAEARAAQVDTIAGEFALYKATAEDRHETQQQVIKELRTELDQTSEDREQLREQLGDALEQLKQVREQVTTLSDQNTSKDIERATLEARLNDETARNQKLEAKLRDVERELHQLQGETSFAQLVLAELKSLKPPSNGAPPLLVHEASLGKPKEEDKGENT